MYTIGNLAKHTNTKVPTIRYYEKAGLLEEPGRTAGGQRRYDKKALNRLAFIRHARELGFGLEAIRDLLGLSDTPEHSCEQADIIASAQLIAVQGKIKRLLALEQELKRMLKQCKHGSIADCRVIEVLGDHNECLHTHHSKD